MIIFGGTKGIGNMLAVHYNKNKFKVSIAGRHPESKGMQGKINVIKADVSKEKNIESAFTLHLKRWGKDPDIVINCAALQGPMGNSWDIPIKKFEETLRVNLLGSFIVAQASIKRMIKDRQGSIIIFSGGGAAYSRPNFSAYAASKAGVLRMVETMAEELRIAGYPDIIINALAPGAVKTGMTAEILKAGKKAGKKALDEAAQVMKNGGTPYQEIISLVDFLIDRKLNGGLTGRLIHVREDYRK
jgi:3-oxoacyl-[acyl-carrier protein] reductase